MKNYDPKSIRNICLLGHVGVGKTSLAEAICHTTKATHKLGKVDNGTSIFDARPDEKDRKMTISMGVGACEWNDTKINVLDTPGFADFLGDAHAALRVVESAVIVVDAFAGPEVGTELVTRLVDEVGVPKIFFVNGMDRENVDFEKTLNAMKDAYGTSVAPLQIPLGTGQEFKGVVDLITKEAFEYKAGGDGRGRKIDIPADRVDEVEAARGALMESVAESDEDLMNKYFEAGELTDDELRKGLNKGCAEGLVFPLFCGCAPQNAGTDRFLNAIVDLCPAADTNATVDVMDGDEKKSIECSPSGQTLAFVFKTISEEHVGELNIVRVFSGELALSTEVQNVTRGSSERLGSMYVLVGKEKQDASKITMGDIGALLKLKDTHTNDTLAGKGVKHDVVKTDFGEPLVSVAIAAKSKGDQDKISMGLGKLREEDPSFTYSFHPDVRQSILSGMGDMHIEVLLAGLKNRFKVEVDRTPPKISYRETVTKPVQYVEYTHKKQTGGAGQYARVFIDLEPMERGGGYQFEDKIVGGVIDQPLRPSVDKGIRAKMTEGILAGFPIVDVRVALVDGKTHPVDSKDVAFQIAGREVFKKAFEMAAPILLEPVDDLKVTVPEEYMGDVMGDLSSRRGKISGMEPKGKYQIIGAKVPSAELQNYMPVLKSMTQGRAFYSKSFSHYDPVPYEQTQKIVEACKKAEGGEES
ncbi:MAG: elongation factor G [Chitinivibrionales bacterium]|nr:elongation factor G [Chitinivibrionales bacterium]MBD3395656.1 elongation factor G [Chitinivibrionales bacterium]